MVQVGWFQGFGWRFW